MFSLPSHKNVIESASILLTACAIFLCVALIDFHANSTVSDRIPEQHLLGVTGYSLSLTVFILFGYGAYLLPAALLQAALLIHQDRSNSDWYPRLLFIAGCGTFALGSLGLINAFIPVSESFPATSGGAIGFAIDRITFAYFNTTGSTIVLTALLTVGLNMISELPSHARLLAVGAWRNWRLSQAKQSVNEILSQDDSTMEITANGVMNIEAGEAVLKGCEEPSRIAPAMPSKLKMHNKRKTSATRRSKIEITKKRLTKKIAKNGAHNEMGDEEGEPEQHETSSTPPLELLHRQSDSEAIQHDPKRI